MSAEEQMSIDERYKYLRQRQKRYRQANRAEKGSLLDEMMAVTGQHRKSLLRLMNGPIERHPRRRERGRTYGPEVTAALVVIAESLDWICPERVKPNLGWVADHLVQHGELVISAEVRHKLDIISRSTVARRLGPVTPDRPRLPQRGPERANGLAQTIPAERIAWDEAQPGHFEVDLVHHCGLSAAGQYVHTLQLVDVATGWSERVAVLGRRYRVMGDGFQRILARLPFAVRELHPDNGSQFLNNHLYRFWGESLPGLRLSRSRAWQKNDNRFVEQKNATLVRAYLGYDRLDTVDQTNLLNHLYDPMWLYYNFFQPVMRLQEKRLQPPSGDGPSRITRHFDAAQTPFDRLCATHVLLPDQQQTLEALRHATNPRRLRQQIYDLIDQLFALPAAAPQSVSQNVYLTLFDPVEPLKGEDIPVTLSNE